MRGLWTSTRAYGPTPEEADSFGWACILVGFLLGVASAFWWAG